MQDFKQYFEFQRDLAEAELKGINQHLKGEKPKKNKGKSKIDTVENVLKSAGLPLHISAIIEIARTDYKTSLERDSVVSILVKKIKAGHKFQRTAPNTFISIE
jgi:hypothetical protein